MQNFIRHLDFRRPLKTPAADPGHPEADFATPLRDLEERERQRVLARIDFAVTIAITFVAGMLVLAIWISL